MGIGYSKNGLVPVKTSVKYGPITKRHSKRPPIPIPEEAYPSAFVKAFLALPKEVQKSILKKWEGFEPYTKDLKTTWIPELHFLDPRPVQATIIQNPGDLAGDVVKVMPVEDANALLYCTDQALKRLIEKDFPASLENTEKNKALQKINDRLPFYRAIERFATFWRTHTPVGLNRSFTGDETFSHTVLGDVGKITVIKTPLWTICDDVRLKGVVEYHQKQSYIPDFNAIFLSIDNMIREDTNSFIAPLQIDESWVPLRTMNWGTKNLETVFGTSMPLVQLAMGYFAASLWTGARIAM